MASHISNPCILGTSKNSAYDTIETNRESSTPLDFILGNYDRSSFKKLCTLTMALNGDAYSSHQPDP